MKFLAALAALLLGAVAGEFLARWPLAHLIIGRGQPTAMMGARAVFTQNAEDLASEMVGSKSSLSDDSTETNRIFSALVGQLGDEHQFEIALNEAGLSRAQLYEKISALGRAGRWIEDQLALSASAEEIALYLQTHPDEFRRPQHLHLRHIFLAAPTGYPEEVFVEKRRLAEESLARLRNKEDFGQIAAQVSEDESSKKAGGDLGWISSERIPPEFFSAVDKLSPGSGPALIQSHLGFHLVEILAVEPARSLSAEEAEAIGRQKLGREKRIAQVGTLARELANQARRTVSD